MQCLHICNDFMGSRVHDNLYRELSSLGISQDQIIFYPLRKGKLEKLESHKSDYPVRDIDFQTFRKAP